MSSVERERGNTGIELTQQQREFFQAGLSNPADFPPIMIAWIEDQIQSRLSAGNIDGFASRVWAPGDPKWVIEDLSGETGEFVYTDNVGSWLYLNGATVSRTVYSGIFAKYGTTFGAGDGSTTFGLPDTRGRVPVCCGSHADLDLGDNEGVAESSRTIRHSHSGGSGWDVGGSLGYESSHTHGVGTLDVGGNLQGHSNPNAPGTAGVLGANGTGSNIGGISALTVTGSTAAGSSHTHSISGLTVTTGTLGTGVAGDAPAFIALGSVVAFIG